MPTSFKTFIVLLVAACASIVNACAQSQEKVYAAMILNFSKGIVWPGPHDNQNFTIGIWAYDPLLAELNSMAASSRVDGRKIVLRNIQAPGDVDGCQVIFLPAYKARALAS
ncbi:MAG TPA: YfiR family protein, partial [Chryseosolibacter sp.]|nr:YfiR family protein [Chryseosolibacter sp.]